VVAATIVTVEGVADMTLSVVLSTGGVATVTLSVVSSAKAAVVNVSLVAAVAVKVAGQTVFS